MIRTDEEYKEAVTRLNAEKNRMDEHKKNLKKNGFTDEQIKLATDPMLSFHLQLIEEVEEYERLKRGDLGELFNLSGLGQLLIRLRIARGVTQKDLAKLLGCDASQISRDERNEYHGVTVERAQKILETLNADLRSKPASPIFPENKDKIIKTA